MILYNTTFVYNSELHEELCKWFREIWLPAAMAAGMEMPLCASVPAGQDATLSVAVQGRFATNDDAESWHGSGGVNYLEALYRKYGERVLAFSTIMEIFEP